MISISRRRALIAGAVAGAAAVLPLVGVGVTAADAVTPACSTADQDQWQKDLYRLGPRVEGLSGFTGIELLDACGPLSLYFDAIPNTLPQTLDQLGLTGRVETRQVAYSLAELMPVQERIFADFAEWESNGLEIRAYWPDMRTGLETVEVADLTTEESQALTNRYGAFVRPVATTRGLAVATADRANDIAPFHAGNFIETTAAGDGSVAVGGCTSGAGVHTGSGLTEKYWMVSAGHCDSTTAGAAHTGGAFVNGYFDGSPKGSNLPLGTSDRNDLASGWDLLTIPVTAKTANTFFAGSPTSTSVYYQGGPQKALAGGGIYTDGAYDGSRAGTVQSTYYNSCQPFKIISTGPTYQSCHVIWAKSASTNTALGGHGDSGGPVYLNVQGPDLKMTGIISAQAADGSAAYPNLPCPYNTWRGLACANNIFFVDLTQALPRLSKSLNTVSAP